MLGASRRDLAAQRQAVIAANPELRERGVGEAGRLLRGSRRGTPRSGVAREPQATLAAEAGMTVLRVALERWANGHDDRGARCHHAGVDGRPARSGGE